MAPSKRRKMSAASEPASDNASSGVQTRRSTSVRGGLPDAPDADLDAEPEELMCPITRTVFRDPVFVVDSGHTYERSAILSHFERNGAKDPLTRRALSSTKVMTNWAMRNVVQAWLDKHPGVTPDGWDSRELLGLGLGLGFLWRRVRPLGPGERLFEFSLVINRCFSPLKKFQTAAANFLMPKWWQQKF